MIVRVLLVAASVLFSASAQAGEISKQRGAADIPADERLVDSSCDPGYCQRVHERPAVVSANHRTAVSVVNGPANYDRYIVRIERDQALVSGR